MTTLRLFVYGTLKPGYQPHEILCRPWLSAHQPALVRGRLYHLPMGYPGLTAEEGWVQGELLIFHDPPPSVLAQLDAFEGYNPNLAPEVNAYHRQEVPVYNLNHQPLGTAWAYMMSTERVRDVNGEWLLEGVWNRPTDLRA
ncbi:gamma-glutamylcyclotransferase family protein [Thermosynechococcus sp. QKsg1]|uniref:gamma-glutamylcyclotransferase family protein n=1 Tax=unclassified Thermosynechococcus TaxID=2622553 RepID=UPI00122E747B|nr:MULTISPECIES: gamma-glutamylcyclotransferase family protein [unclassified Thermosynechococcus]QEQ02106.1 gamma-glutamylcyclotransferase [Thermosynechococcus sp. CL-1]WJI23995.1 gamma-glutamylcyclotransferase [Thermosynechococcus sp. B0]WNC86628.1 gamma-glutamylcyclotransferase family protein [Thermosynechococcus sp. QKsg1]